MVYQLQQNGIKKIKNKIKYNLFYIFNMNLTENYIRELVKEELGIALEVTNTSNQIFQDILTDLRKQKPEKTDICFIKTGSVNSSLHGVNFKVNYICRNFSNKDLVENFDIDALTEGGSVFLDKRFVFVNVNLIAFNGTVDNKEALNTIQHEIEHIYQQIRANKRIPSDDLKYAKMKTDLEGNDENRRNVARLVYLCYKSEQEGFINGTYAWCMTNDAMTPPYNYSNIKNSPAGKLYTEMQELNEKVFNNHQLAEIIVNEYNLNQNQVNKMMRGFARKLGRVLVKVNFDKAKLWRM